MSIQRLVTEFKAEDVGAFMVCRVEHEHIRVAQWIDGNNVWAITPEGQMLLDAADGVVVESATERVEEKQTRRGRAPKNAFANALDGDEA